MNAQKSFFIVSVMVLSFVFTACSKDDDEKSDIPGDLVGTWSLVYSEGYEKLNGSLIEEWDDEYDYDPDNELTFTLKGTMTFWDEGDKYIAYFAYRNNRIYLVDDEDGEEYLLFNVTKLTSDTLVLEMNIKDGNEEFYDKSTYRNIN